MRTSLAALLILAGAVLTFPAVIAGWEQRVLLDENRFLDLGSRMLEDEAVQDAVATAAARQVLDVAAANDAADLLTEAEAYSLALNLVDDLQASRLGEIVLTSTHRLIVFTFEGPSDETQERRNEIVLDLRPVVQQVLMAASLLYPDLLDDIVLPEGTGVITILHESKAGFVVRTARWFNDIAIYIVLLPLVAFGLALLVATDRPLALLFVGLAVLCASAVRIFFLRVVLESLVVRLTVNDGRVASAVYEDLANSFVAQELLVIAVGAGLTAAGLAWLAARRVWE